MDVSASVLCVGAYAQLLKFFPGLLWGVFGRHEAEEATGKSIDGSRGGGFGAFMPSCSGAAQSCKGRWL